MPAHRGVGVGTVVHADHVTCYYTTDGSDPAGDRGRADPRLGRRFRADACRVGHADVGVRGDAGRGPSRPSQRARSSDIGSRHGPSTSRRDDLGDGDRRGRSRRPSRRASPKSSGIVLGRRTPRRSGPSRAAAASPTTSTTTCPGLAARRGHLPGLHRSLRDDRRRAVRRARDARRLLRRDASRRHRASRSHHRLGVTCIWLSPLFPSPSHHGYDATDLRLRRAAARNARTISATLTAARMRRASG